MLKEVNGYYNVKIPCEWKTNKNIIRLSFTRDGKQMSSEWQFCMTDKSTHQVRFLFPVYNDTSNFVIVFPEGIDVSLDSFFVK